MKQILHLTQLLVRTIRGASSLHVYVLYIYISTIHFLLQISYITLLVTTCAHRPHKSSFFSATWRQQRGHLCFVGGSTHALQSSPYTTNGCWNVHGISSVKKCVMICTPETTRIFGSSDSSDRNTSRALLLAGTSRTTLHPSEEPRTLDCRATSMAARVAAWADVMAGMALRIWVSSRVRRRESIKGAE